MRGLSDVIQFPLIGIEAKARARAGEETALVRRVQARDEMAFREIVDRYQAKVFSIICGILRNRNDAEDIAQQVFAKIYFSIHNFDFRSSLLTWIYQTRLPSTSATTICASGVPGSWCTRAIVRQRTFTGWRLLARWSIRSSQ